MGGEEGLGVTTGQPNLYKQDLSQLDVTKLTALSREVISRQATINIGTIGHVAHGKSTIVKAISGVQTVRFKNELERNITIKLEARGAESMDGERADIPDETRKMPTIHGKRPLSPQTIEPCAKQPKLNESQNACSFKFDRRDAGNLTTEINISSNNVYTDELAQDAASNSLKEDTMSKDGVISVDQGLSPNCHDVDFLKKNDVDSCVVTPLPSENTKGSKIRQSIKIKQCRVLLKNIMADKKYVKYFSAAKQPITDKKNDLWEVESIMGKKERDGITVYLVKWKNWSSAYNTWEPISNLVNCNEILDEFETTRLQLLEKFKTATKFQPTAHDVKAYLENIKKKGESLDCDHVKDENLYDNISKFLKPNSVKKGKLKEDIKDCILRMLLHATRRDQLDSLEEWEKEINHITQGKPDITVENNVDLEAAPQDFFYIDNYLPGLNVTIPDDPLVGCECTECSHKSKCCYASSGTTFSYTSACRVRVPPGTPIYECNKRCACSENCLNRVVQRGSRNKLCIFRTSNGTGWGVKTLKAIRKGTFVTQYVGEVITNEEAEKRGIEYDAAGRTYLFDLDYNNVDDECPYTVDAAVYGNISHFINHSCDPNLAVYGVWINCLDPNLPLLALFATRDIKKNEEITFDYMCQSSRINEKKKYIGIQNDLQSNETQSRLQIHDNKHDADVPANKTLCKCGAENCRQYLF